MPLAPQSTCAGRTDCDEIGLNGAGAFRPSRGVPPSSLLELPQEHGCLLNFCLLPQLLQVIFKKTNEKQETGNSKLKM